MTNPLLDPQWWDETSRLIDELIELCADPETEPEPEKPNEL
jgi:hypothetical protein